MRKFEIILTAVSKKCFHLKADSKEDALAAVSAKFAAKPVNTVAAVQNPMDRCRIYPVQNIARCAVVSFLVARAIDFCKNMVRFPTEIPCSLLQNVIIYDNI